MNLQHEPARVIPFPNTTARRLRPRPEITPFMRLAGQFERERPLGVDFFTQLLTSNIGVGREPTNPSNIDKGGV